MSGFRIPWRIVRVEESYTEQIAEHIWVTVIGQPRGLITWRVTWGEETDELV